MKFSSPLLVACMGLAICTSATAQWTVKSLHPDWAIRSYAYGVFAEQVVGMAEGTSAVLWNGTTGECTNLQPLVASWSWANAVGGNQQVGVVEINNEWCASLWSGTAESWVNLHPLGPQDQSYVLGADGTQQVGYLFTNTNEFLASLWTGSADSWVSLNPPGVQIAHARAVSEGQQVGEVELPSREQHASLWTGSAESWVDLHPHAVNGSSSARSVDRGQQVGTVSINGQVHASLWSGTPESWIDLNPSGATDSSAHAVSHGVQLGRARFCGENRPVLWYGTAESCVDLALPLPDGYHSPEANWIWSDGVTIRIAGQAWNTALSRHEAMLWTGPYAPPCRADFNRDGFVNGDDYDTFAALFESGEAGADLNRDCFVNGDDYDEFAEAFEAGC